MPKSIHFIAKPFAERYIKTIQLSGQTHTSIKVIHIIKTHHSIFLHLIQVVIPRLIYATEKHTIGKVYTRRNTNVLECHKRSRRTQFMIQTVIPIFHKTRLKEFILFAGNRVRKRATILQTDLLVPFLFTHCLLAFERINTAHIHIQTRQSHTQSRVFSSLGQVHTQTDTPWAIWETLRIRHTRASRIFCIGLHIVITIDITTIITRCLKVHTRREIAIRIGFTILRMRPLNTQVFSHIVIRHILFARHIPTIIHRQTTLEFISFDISTSRIYSPSTTRINITRQLQIKIIIDCKIITNTRHIQSTRIIISKIRHYETTRVIIRKRKESKRYRQRQWHISHH